ncbi:hydantoinase B/oxoprolinase family protein, partial [Deferrisoma camini]|uniref:hydantoinase B/oxoprolinase family protein n=1 Tax=Deferrisoma camini TaxID=1035120 RepID=UPI0004A30420
MSPASPAAEVAILRHRLKSLTREMGLALLHTARSPILAEARDFVTGLYDARGRMLEQTEYIPVLAFAVQPALQDLIETFGDDVGPGDVFLHNDVFRGGNQLADVCVFRPVFVGNRLVAWAAVKGHQADIGGAVGGGYNPRATEVWQEGLRIPPVRVVRRGRRLRDVWDLILANIRYPVVAEDLEAAMGACVVGERGMRRIVDRMGLPAYLETVEALMDATERRMRAAIREFPPGRYEGEAPVGAGAEERGHLLWIRCQVEVGDGEVLIRYDGTSAQTEGFLNAPASASLSAAVLTLLMILAPDIPHNEGMLRPLRIRLPEGTILAARAPAATGFGNTLTGAHADALFKAFFQARPDRVTAGWNRMLAVVLAGRDPRSGGAPYVDILFNALKGGSGAMEGCDGYDHIGLINCAGGILAQDPEMFERAVPHRLERHEYAPGTAGRGRWRGGRGVVTRIRFGAPVDRVVVFGDGLAEETRAFGLAGGQPGSRNHLFLDLPDGRRLRPRSLDLLEGLPEGTVLCQVAGGGGGFGSVANEDK